MSVPDRAARIGAVVDIGGVSLRSLDAYLPDLAGVAEPIELVVSWETSHRRPSPTEVAYTYRFALTAPSPHDMHVKLELELDYELQADAEVDAADLDAFGDVSVSSTAHPYARELVQNLTTRASLPPVVLDVLRAPIDPPDRP